MLVANRFVFFLNHQIERWQQHEGQQHGGEQPIVAKT
jgi:hypothetical protein